MKNIKSKTLKKKKLQSKKPNKLLKIRKNPNIYADSKENIKEMKIYLKSVIDNESIIQIIFDRIDSNISCYGILKFSTSNRFPNIPKHYKNSYSFQFNPLNQWKYQKREEIKEKIQPIERTSNKPEFIDYGNEFDVLSQIESQFDHDEPTYEFIFHASEINVIHTENNRIYFYYDVKFNPKLLNK